jgi:hypothetical protein
MLDYFRGGASIGAFIDQGHGHEASTLSLAAVWTMQLPLFYDLDPPLADKLAAFILVKMTTLKVPENLWKPLAKTRRLGQRAHGRL